ncbi:MAG TPA: calcium-binding protein [Solirubrobacterales bacterium]
MGSIRGKRGVWSGVALAAFAASVWAPALRADVPEPTVCDSASGTVKFESVGTLREEISAYQDPTGAIVVTASGANEDEGYTRQDTCPELPGQPWKLVVLSGDSGSDTIYVGTLTESIKAKLNGGGTLDTLEGHAGVDELRGGSSHDTLRGFEGGDLFVGGSGQDKVLAGKGADVIKVNDGGRQADSVKCGGGIDSVFADPPDKLKGCEKVHGG